MRRRLIRILGVLIVSLLAPGFAIVGGADRPFGLPLSGAAGPSSWYVSQFYGHTLWAQRNWQDLYRAGQGLHFGIDFADPCGTEVIAIGDGVVFAVDGPYGSAPHNVVIDHRNSYLSLYGHLHDRSPLRPGQPISRGSFVGNVGDPATSDCNRAPHLHLEIRRTGMGVAVNPVPLIDADWRSLTIGAGTDGTRFALDYGAPGAGMAIDDQPDVRFGGPILSTGRDGWPPQ